MPISPQKFKDKLSDFRRLFLMETAVFDKLVVIYKYFRYLNSEPLAKELLNRISDEAEALGAFVRPDEVGVEEYLEIDRKAMYSKDFWLYMSNLENIHDKMKRMKECKLENRDEYEKICKLYSKPYSEDMLSLSMEIINSKIFEEISKDKFIADEEEKTWFDDKETVKKSVSGSHLVFKIFVIQNRVFY